MADTEQQDQQGQGSNDPARERDELLDQLQRTRAEFLNYQKRSKAQAEEERKYAIGRVALDLVSVMDNFERAAEAARSAGVPSIVDGLDLVYRQLLATLSKHGVEPMTTVGTPFDPNRHEALMQQPSEEHPEGTVLMELGKGYTIHDRVLRPAKVAVSVRPS